MPNEKMIEKLIFQFSTRSHIHRPFIVGIDGLSGAGKTTFLKRIKQALINNCKVATFHLDDHIVKRNKRYWTDRMV